MEKKLMKKASDHKSSGNASAELIITVLVALFDGLVIGYLLAGNEWQRCVASAFLVIALAVTVSYIRVVILGIAPINEH